MKHSLRLKITFLLTCCITATILLSWIINRSFLTDYYQYSKVKALDRTYYEVNDYFSNLKGKQLTDENKEDLERLGLNNNVNIYIFNKELVNIFRTNNTERESGRIYDSIRAYLGFYPFLEAFIDRIKIEDNYDLYKQLDQKMQMNYLDLIGYLDNNYLVFFRTNFQSIQESVKISNKFFAYVGILTTILGTVAMFLISRKFTKPILKLSDIAKKMSELDFDIKYDDESQDEIGILGSSINTLSERLEQTISELKSANNELQSDIQNKIQIDEMRKEFLSNVTHELKTPIALIQGYAEGLKDNINEDEESRDFYCEVIIDEAMKMNKMVKKLLSLNQIEFGTSQVEFERFDIVSLIKSVLNSTEILMKQKNVTLHFEDYEPIFVWADEYMIEEVVTNYISNAIHHVSGANIIEVKLVKKENTIRVAVFNTGENIPEEDIDKVWIKFYKVDKARTREYGGSGIGLSIVKAIMITHNRECGVINHKTGVEFWFELDTQN